jgi:hypothetical protein
MNAAVVKLAEAAAGGGRPQRGSRALRIGPNGHDGLRSLGIELD